MISIESVKQYYGGTQILWDLDLEVERGSVTCIMGRNGVGKTTLLKCLMGLLPVSAGQIQVDGVDYTHSSAESRARGGIGYVPQGRDIFPLLTVEENLKIALGSRPDRSRKIPERIFDLFPVLAEMMNRRGGTSPEGSNSNWPLVGRWFLTPRY